MKESSNISRRREIEAPDSTDQEWIDKIIVEIYDLNKQYNDPDDHFCKHCLNISLRERFDELKILGYI